MVLVGRLAQLVASLSFSWCSQVLPDPKGPELGQGAAELSINPIPELPLAVGPAALVSPPPACLGFTSPKHTGPTLWRNRAWPGRRTLSTREAA